MIKAINGVQKKTPAFNRRPVWLVTGRWKEIIKVSFGWWPWSRACRVDVMLVVRHGKREYHGEETVWMDMELGNVEPGLRSSYYSRRAGHLVSEQGVELYWELSTAGMRSWGLREIMEGVRQVMENYHPEKANRGINEPVSQRCVRQPCAKWTNGWGKKAIWQGGCCGAAPAALRWVFVSSFVKQIFTPLLHAPRMVVRIRCTNVRATVSLADSEGVIPIGDCDYCRAKI